MPSTTYQVLNRQVALLVNAILGPQSNTLESNYNVSPLTATQVVSADFGLTPIQDAILRAEEVFVQAVANVQDKNGQGCHPYRTSIGALTSPLPNFSVLPTLSASGKPIVGVWGDFYDAVTGNSLKWVDNDSLSRFQRGSTQGQYVTQQLYYSIDSRIIRHTVANCVGDCCIYKRADQVVGFNTNSVMLLPDNLEPGIVELAASFCFRDTVFESQAQIHRNNADKVLAEIAAGKVPTGEGLRA